MSAEKPVLNHSEITLRSASERPQKLHTAIRHRCATSQFDVVVAAVSNDLRISSAKTNELMKKSLRTISLTTKLVVFSREAIASSRTLLVDHNDPAYRIGIKRVAHADELP
jgi:hypothetical protein